MKPIGVKTMNRRVFIAACASAALLPSGTTHAHCDWLVAQLTPGTLISIRGDAPAVQHLISEIMREKPRSLTHLNRNVRTPEDLKRVCMRQGLSAVVGPIKNLCIADIVTELDGDCLTILKHRHRHEREGNVIHA